MDEEKFWRLLQAFEVLARNEGPALKRRDFVGVAQIHDAKAAVLDQMVAIGTGIGLTANDPRLKPQIDRILKLQRANAEYIEECLAAISEARLDAQCARRLLRRLGRIYCAGGAGEHVECAA